MGLIGMVVSGCGFLSIGLWQAWSTLALSSLSPGGSSSRSLLRKGPPLRAAQLTLIAAMAALHTISGLIESHKHASLNDGTLSAIPLERSAAACGFFIFAIASLVSEKTRLLPLPREGLQMIALFAFAQEFLLFYLQRPDAGLESRYFDLLLVPIAACIASTALSLAYPLSALPPLTLSAALVLQGTWLIQMGASLFSTAFMAKGCALKPSGEGDYPVTCAADMALMRGKAVATLQFNCHMALVLVTLLPLYSLCTRKENRLPDSNGLNYEMVGTTESYELKRTAEHGSGFPPPSAFSLGMDEDEALPDHQDANGFQTLAI